MVQVFSCGVPLCETTTLMSRRVIASLPHIFVHRKDLPHIGRTVMDSAVIISILYSPGTLIAGAGGIMRWMDFIFRILVKIVIPGNRFSIIPTCLVLLIDSTLSQSLTNWYITIVNTNHKIILSKFYRLICSWRVAQEISPKVPERGILLLELQMMADREGFEPPEHYARRFSRPV